MTTHILSPEWEGEIAAPVDPSTIRFKAVPAPAYANCQGCLFAGQRVAVCWSAAEIAVRNEQPDCDGQLPGGRSIIYVLDKSDPRQLDLLKARRHG